MVAKVAASVIARHGSNVSGAGYCRPMSMMLPPELEPGSGWGWRRTVMLEPNSAAPPSLVENKTSKFDVSISII